MPATKEVNEVEKVKEQTVKLQRVCAYVRTCGSNDDGLVEQTFQISYFTQLAQRNPSWDFVGVYADKGLDSHKERAGFQKMLADCRGEKIDLILTHSISRFARDMVTVLNSLTDLRDLGVDVYFEKENFHSVDENINRMKDILISFQMQRGGKPCKR